MNTIQNYGTNNYSLGFKACSVQSVHKEWLTPKRWEQLVDSLKHEKYNLQIPNLTKPIAIATESFQHTGQIDLSKPSKNRTAIEEGLENYLQLLEEICSAKPGDDITAKKERLENYRQLLVKLKYPIDLHSLCENYTAEELAFSNYLQLLEEICSAKPGDDITAKKELLVRYQKVISETITNASRQGALSRTNGKGN